MKKTKGKYNALIAAFLALIVVLEIGYISLTHPIRSDWSKRKFYELAPRTQEIVGSLNQDVKIIVLFPELHPLCSDVRNLVEEYKALSPRRIETVWIDPVSAVEEMEKLSLEYDLTNASGQIELPMVIFSNAEKSEVKTRRIVRLLDMVEMERVEGRKEPALKAFKGEEAFTSALYGLIHGENPKVYFLSGHGEASINDSGQMTGLSDVWKMAARNNLDFVELVLDPTSEIPVDAAAVVIPGPKEEFAAFEVELIQRYLVGGGRLMVLLDAAEKTGLESLLYQWQIGVRDDIVVDLDNTQKGGDVIVRYEFCNPQQPIANVLKASGQNLQFYLPRSVSPLVLENTDNIDPQEVKHTDWLFISSNRSYTKLDIGERETIDLAREANDLSGAQCLGATVSRGGGTTMGGKRVPLTRMIVIGDSNFICNGFLGGGNPELLLGSLNWLIERDVSLAPKPIEEIQLNLSKKEITKLGAVSVVGVPGVAAVLGLFVWYRRRK